MTEYVTLRVRKEDAQHIFDSYSDVTVIEGELLGRSSLARLAGPASVPTRPKGPLIGEDTKDEAQEEQSLLEIRLCNMLGIPKITKQAKSTLERNVVDVTAESVQTHKSPIDLYEENVLFRRYVEWRVNGILKHADQSKKPSAYTVASALCNYRREYLGWFDYQKRETAGEAHVQQPQQIVRHNDDRESDVLGEDFGD